jgi:hypothetical protein
VKISTRSTPATFLTCNGVLLRVRKLSRPRVERRDVGLKIQTYLGESEKPILAGFTKICLYLEDRHLFVRAIRCVEVHKCSSVCV